MQWTPCVGFKFLSHVISLPMCYQCQLDSLICYHCPLDLCFKCPLDLCCNCLSICVANAHSVTDALSICVTNTHSVCVTIASRYLFLNTSFLMAFTVEFWNWFCSLQLTVVHEERLLLTAAADWAKSSSARQHMLSTPAAYCQSVVPGRVCLQYSPQKCVVRKLKASIVLFAYEHTGIALTYRLCIIWIL